MSWFFESWTAVARIATLAVLTYLVVLALLRVSGNRTLAKTAAFDQVVSVALGSTLATAMLSKETTLTEGATGFLMLVLLQFVFASLILRSRWVQRLVVQKPQVLVWQGRLREETLRKTRLVESDVHAALRKASVGRVDAAALVVLESDGTFSVVPKQEGQPLDVVAGIEDDL
ncbi:DUF421 domain-containing protein [soil metagenome]